MLLNLNYSQAQQVDNYWFVGYEKSSGFPFGPTSLDFKNMSPTISYNIAIDMNFNFTAAFMSDTSSNLLFYTNGVWVANALHDTMQNGFGINPSTYTTQQAIDNDGIRITGAALILPSPNHQNQYYLIHETSDSIDSPYPSYLYYSVIDMTLDSGMGGVISQNNIILNDTLQFGQIVACKHANGRDWWIIAPERAKNSYFTILLGPIGIQSIFSQAIGIRTIATGQAVFSPDGSRYASYDTYTDLEVYDFDRCTGLFSNPQHVSIIDSMVGLGVAFSPDGSKIYCSATEYLYQFDLNVPNLAASQTTVAVWDSTYSPQPPFATMFFTQALRPDGKIYITTGNGTDRMHTIDYPDSAGLACQVSQHSVVLPTYNSSTCPTFPNYYLGPVVGSICDSLTVGIAENTVQSAELRLNPNPVSDKVWVNYKFPNNKDGWLEIYDAIGKLVLKRRLYWSTTNLLLYTNELKNGMYVVRVYDDTNLFRSNGKLVKN